MEGTAEVIGVKAGDDDALTHVRQSDYRFNDLHTQELGFIDADDLSAQIQPIHHVCGIFHVGGADLDFRVRDDVVVSIALVDAGLEDLDTLTRDLGAAQAADEFFALAAEHRTANHFDPSESTLGKIHY